MSFLYRPSQRVEMKTFEMRDAGIGYPGVISLLHNTNLMLPAGRFYWLRGPNGSGKSTVLKTLAGLCEVASGDYRINGASVPEMSFEEFMPYRASMGFGFGVSNLLSNRTLEENLQLPILFHRETVPDEAKALIGELAERFGFQKFRDHRPFGVPVSFQRIVTLIRAFMRKPNTVFLDEPTSGLTRDLRERFSIFVKEQVQNHGLSTAFVVSDDQEFILQFDPVILEIDGTTLRASEEKAVAI